VIEETFCEATEVTFATLSDASIQAYVQSGQLYAQSHLPLSLSAPACALLGASVVPKSLERGVS